MKKLLFVLILAARGLYGAGCEYFSGYAESDNLTFYTGMDACASGQTESPGLAVVDNAAPCASGTVEAQGIKEVVCDSSKGNCAAVYICPAL